MADNSWRFKQRQMVAEALERGLRRVLLLDTETTGLDPEDGAVCIEAACIRFDLRHAQVLDAYSSLIHHPAGNPIEDVNHIPSEMVRRAPKAEAVWRRVAKMIRGSDLIVAHRVEFDYQFVPDELRTTRPWCCSKFDIEWPHGKNGDDLLHLALANGVGVVYAHRAMSDTEVLARVFARTMERYDILEILRRALRPKTLVVSLEPFQRKDHVKSLGFAFDSKTKDWYKWMPIEDVGKLSIKYKVVESG
jgi:DNA polymerase III epsilon subunit-like protein